ncbi:unnamed protein product (mitochondrion) [Plasmodiophora brassicae]|uniref:Cyclic nucleotide-binding domain-containing protein n=1 Tax=Plasmodiophora brassicae TaxID=37360 RepID=A0A3P3YA93_PLABS|nr:unnamed protein product [Plasmodiophora brassicae]
MLVRNPVQDWSVDDVQDWLKRNGFADYCTRFLLEEVDGPQMLTMSRRGLVLMGIEDSALLAAIHRLRDLKPRVGVISDRELNAVVTELNETIEWLVSRIPSDKMKKRVRQGLTTMRNHHQAMTASGATGEYTAIVNGILVSADDLKMFVIDAGEDPNEVSDDETSERVGIMSLHQLTKAAAEANTARQAKRKTKGTARAAAAKRAAYKQIVEQARFDVRLKHIRRHSRIIVPTEVMPVASGESDTAIEEENVSKKKRRFLLLPTDPIRTRFDFLMMFLVLYFAVTTPMNLAFDLGLDSSIVVELVMDSLFVIDIISNFFTAFTIVRGRRAGQLETRRSEIAKQYMKAWFWLDLVATVPIDLIIPLVDPSSSATTGAQFNKLIRLLRGFKLMRVLRMSRIAKRISKKFRLNAAVVSILKILVCLTFTWHCLGCFYWMIFNVEGLDNDWSPPQEVQSGSLSLRYLRSVFWAVNQTMSVGTNTPAETLAETVYTVACVFIGLVLNAIIVGLFKQAVDELDLASKVHLADLEEVAVKLRHYRCPKGLITQICGYFSYLQSRYLDYTSRNLFDGLHPALREELLLALNAKLIQQVPMFRDVSRVCLLSIISKLRSRIYNPQEYIALKGEKCTEMFFIVNGSVQCTADDDDDGGGGDGRGRILREGDYFCERSVMTSDRVSATYRSMSYSELYVLERSDFKRLLQQFPTFVITMYRHMNPNATYWQKVGHSVKLTRLLRRLGNIIQFTETYALYSRGVAIDRKDIEVANELLGDDLVPPLDAEAARIAQEQRAREDADKAAAAAAAVVAAQAMAANNAKKKLTKGRSSQKARQY